MLPLQSSAEAVLALGLTIQLLLLATAPAVAAVGLAKTSS
jgi:hypothetical protein